MGETAQILFLAADPPAIERTTAHLCQAGYPCEGMTEPAEALFRLRTGSVGLLIIALDGEPVERTNFFEQVRQLPAAPSLILLAEELSVSVTAALLQVRVAAYLFNPISLERLLGEVQRVLGERVACESPHNPNPEVVETKQHSWGVEEAEAALRAAKEYAALLIHSSLDMIIAVDAQRRITEFNPAAEQAFGYRKAEVLGQHVDLLYADPVEGRQVHLKTLRQDGFILEIRNKRKTGEAFDAYLAASVMRDPSGQLVGVMGISRNITEQKQADAELRQSRDAAETASRAKSEFLAMMSHELRTPLHLILGYTELLKEGAGGALPAEALAILAMVHTSAGELGEFITAMLNVSHMETDQLTVVVTPVSVAELLAELQADTQAVQEQSGLDFVWQVSEPLPSLATDPGKLKIVLKNLVGNALKFTAQGQVSIRAQSEAGGVTIAVTDTGIGIPAAALGMIFEPFRQADSSNTRPYGGMGLGLYLVKRLVALLGGTVTVESTIGQGSTFRVWLPATLPSVPSSRL